MSDMRILHCINSTYIYGGAEKIVDCLCNEANHEKFTIFNGETSNIVDKLLAYFRFFFFLVFNRYKYDFFHFHLFPAFYFSIIIPRDKVIIHEHNTYNRRRDFKFFKYIEKVLYVRAKNVICISDSVHDSLCEWLGGNDNFKVVPNFSRFKYKKARFKNKKDDVNVVMIASFSKQKKQDLVIKSVAYLPSNYKFHFLGDGPTLKSCMSLCSELDLNEQINFHGNVDNVSDYINLSDFCILLSSWEGFGMVVVEAASLNKVTLSSDVSGLSSVVNNEKLLITEGESSIQIANKIESISNVLKSSPSYFDDYCYSISDKYSYDKYIINLNKIYLSSH
ncbi:glycosyltransferase [Vibrio sp. TH_r3]|uniref:glycosyltransferase n=1 Tax=Vibrio sp. TH_r3 TaxID=3082084 RepID=UPI002953F797|nr:glycosyltransferase [Vibrio sp. TH_r3]MDV7106003.1 glycosyltransferase [Vibrio sp. TH_r3]